VPGEDKQIARLQSVLRRCADICRKRRRHGDDELAAVLHRSAQVRKLLQQLLDLISGLVADAAEAGAVRQDVPAEELASYCVTPSPRLATHPPRQPIDSSTSSGPESPPCPVPAPTAATVPQASPAEPINTESMNDGRLCAQAGESKMASEPDKRQTGCLRDTPARRHASLPVPPPWRRQFGLM
jgi:hypothetical protein